jgi:hypothetical protein
MIMPIIAKDTGKTFDPAPEGLFVGVCVDVVDLGPIKTAYGLKPKVRIVWELAEVDPATQRRYLVSRMYSTSLNEKAALRADLESWRGRPFTLQQVQEGVDLEQLISACCQLSIVHAVGSKGGTFANVQAVVPLGKGMAKIAPSGLYVRATAREAATDGTQPTVSEPKESADPDVPF